MYTISKNYEHHLQMNMYKGCIKLYKTLVQWTLKKSAQKIFQCANGSFKYSVQTVVQVITSVTFIFLIQGLPGKAGANGAKGGVVSTVYQSICDFHESKDIFGCIDSDKRDILMVIIIP